MLSDKIGESIGDAEINTEGLKLMVKTAGVSVVTEIASAVCRDASETALAKTDRAYRENNNSGYDFACDRRNNQIMCKPLRKVKKTVTTLAFLMLVIFLLPIAASAADTGNEKITSDDFAVEISDETSKILESMGIENIDYDSLISASPRKIITCIIDIAKGKLKEPVKTLGIVLSIAVVAAVVGSFAPSKTAEKYSVGTVCSFLIVSALTVPLASTLSSAASSIALTA